MDQCESIELRSPITTTSFALELGITRKRVILPFATCASIVVWYGACSLKSAVQSFGQAGNASKIKPISLEEMADRYAVLA